MDDKAYFSTCRAIGGHTQECFLQILQYYIFGRQGEGGTNVNNIKFSQNSARKGERIT